MHIMQMHVSNINIMSLIWNMIKPWNAHLSPHSAE